MAHAHCMLVTNTHSICSTYCFSTTTVVARTRFIVKLNVQFLCCCLLNGALAWPGLNWPGLDCTGLDWTGLAWTELDWPGLDWIALAWTELAWPGLNWPGLD